LLLRLARALRQLRQLRQLRPLRSFRPLKLLKLLRPALVFLAIPLPIYPFSVGSMPCLVIPLHKQEHNGWKTRNFRQRYA